MATSNLKMKKYILAIGDIVLLYFSLWITLFFRFYSEYTYNLWREHFLPFSILYFVWLIVFYIDGLYELGYEKGRMNLVSALIRNLIICSGFAVTFFYFGNNRLFNIKPQKVFLINILVVFLLLFLWRQIFYFFIKSPRLADKILIIGLSPLALEIVEEINSRPELGFKVNAIIGIDQPENFKADNLPKNIHVYQETTDFKNICLSEKIDTIISAVEYRKNPLLLENLFKCLPLKIEFFEISSFYEKITGKIPVANVQQTWFLENINENSKRFYETLKRMLDVALSSLGLVIALPFSPLIAALIKLDNPGPFLFKQIRVGKNGKNFLAMKFRTMKTNAEINGPQWALKNDSRVTRIGKFLRKTRIDEVPQLFNILRGEMSLIGPRPERPEFITQLKKIIPFYEERLLVKPGLTGWAQVMGPAYGGSEQESLEKLQYDLFYVKNRSLGMDLSIALKTIKTILKGSGQ